MPCTAAAKPLLQVAPCCLTSSLKLPATWLPAAIHPHTAAHLRRPGLCLQVVVSSFEETLPKERYSAADYARHTASHKALDVARQLAAAAAAGAAPPPALVIGADTVVEYGEHILEKPADAADAARVLRMLSGKRHHVHTGVALVLPPLEAPAAAAAGEAATEAATEEALGGEGLPQLAWHTRCTGCRPCPPSIRFHHRLKKKLSLVCVQSRGCTPSR